MTLPATCRDLFIEGLMETGNVSTSAAMAGVNRLTAYRWRDDYPEFAQAWDLALEVARQGLRERVVETAAAIGLGQWVPLLDDDFEPVLDPITGEPVTRLTVGHVDARVLMKWMDKTLSDSPTKIDKTTRVFGGPKRVEIVLVSSEDGRARYPLGLPETDDAEFEEVGAGDG